ncbi:MAG: hypothetical protein ACK4WM_08050 [Thermoflexales bacterium]
MLETGRRTQRAYARLLWELLTSDVLLLALLAIVGLGCVALALLPQAPGDAIVEPTAYSRWEIFAYERSGAWFAMLRAAGLFRVEQALWWRTALALGIGALALRLADGLATWFSARHAAALTRRYRVALGLVPLDTWAERLRQQRWRILHHSSEELVADRAPYANGFAALFHLGLLLAAVGLLGNALLGWQVNERVVSSNAPLELPGGARLHLAENVGDLAVRLVITPGREVFVMQAGQERTQRGVWLKVHRLQTGYRVSASDASERPLSVRVSTLGTSSDVAVVLMDENETERFVAVPEAKLGLVLQRGNPPELDDRLQVLGLPKGEVITNTLVPDQLTLSQAKLRFQPLRTVTFSAHYRPLAGLVWIGGLLALLGAAGMLVQPPQQVVMRHRHGWTEVCAAGWRARSAIAPLLHEPLL